VAWIESHQELANHPKLVRFARLLDVHRTYAIGLLHRLWWWALDHAEDGDLSQFDAADLADACGWEGDAETLVKALRECGPGNRAGFVEEVEGRWMLHDWWEYAGKLVARRRADRDRKRSERTPRPAVPLEVDGVSAGRPADGAQSPYVTEQNRTEPSDARDATRHLSAVSGPGSSATPTLSADFDAWWETYPRKVAKQAASTAYAKARKTATAEALTEGLQRSIAQWQREQRTIDKHPHASTWLNQERWNDDYGSPPSTDDRYWIGPNGQRVLK